MSEVREARYVLVYGDATRKTYTIPNISEDGASEFEDKIVELKQGLANASASYADYRETFKSATGAEPINIAEASIIVTDEEVIYSG